MSDQNLSDDVKKMYKDALYKQADDRADRRIWLICGILIFIGWVLYNNEVRIWWYIPLGIIGLFASFWRFDLQRKYQDEVYQLSDQMLEVRYWEFEGRRKAWGIVDKTIFAIVLVVLAGGLFLFISDKLSEHPSSFVGKWKIEKKLFLNFNMVIVLKGDGGAEVSTGVEPFSVARGGYAGRRKRTISFWSFQTVVW